MNNNLLMGETGLGMGNSYNNNNYLSDINNMKIIIDAIVYNCKDFLGGDELVILNNTLNEVLSKYEIVSDSLTEKWENFEESNRSLLEKYLRAIAVEGKSERTINYYRGTFEYFLEYINKPLPEVTTQDIRDYLYFRDETGEISNTSLDNIRRVLNTIFRWLHEEMYILKNPVISIKKIKRDKKIVPPLTAYEIELIRKELNEHTDIAGVRDKAIFELLLSSGVRVAELVQLDINNIDFDNRSFIVFGKGGKERECYFNAKAQLSLEIYLNQRTDDSPELFVSSKSPYTRLGINGVERRLRETGRKVNIRLFPHLLRKTFATNLLRKGVQIEQVQILLGHAKLETTTIYARVDETNLNNSHKKLLN